ncbi:hypothetical protein [Psychroflexus torquis]|uniref:hypothetical protein n=1 Tax=Psychroflexus torquis TaxID=57029 RepID=UPI0002EB45A2|nr:hypothetical protein [Psychroflexus torquis]
MINSKGGRGFTPLLFARYFGEIKMIEYLLTKVPIIEAQDVRGHTSLMGFYVGVN